MAVASGSVELLAGFGAGAVGVSGVRVAASVWMMPPPYPHFGQWAGRESSNDLLLHRRHSNICATVLYLVGLSCVRRDALNGEPWRSAALRLRCGDRIGVDDASRISTVRAVWW